MSKICPCCKYVSNLYQTITFTWLLRINTYLANICICPHFSRQRKCNANLELQIYHIFAPFANISKFVFSSSVSCQLLPSAPVTWSCQREGKALKKIQNVLRPWNQLLAYKTMLWMSGVRTLAWCFHILEMSSIHTGEHTKQQRFKSKRRKIVNGKDCVTFHKTTAYHCCHSFLRRKLRGVFIPSWVILDQRFLESTTPDRW